MLWSQSQLNAESCLLSICSHITFSSQPILVRLLALRLFWNNSYKGYQALILLELTTAFTQWGLSLKNFWSRLLQRLQHLLIFLFLTACSFSDSSCWLLPFWTLNVGVVWAQSLASLDSLEAVQSNHIALIAIFMHVIPKFMSVQATSFYFIFRTMFPSPNFLCPKPFPSQWCHTPSDLGIYSLISSWLFYFQLLFQFSDSSENYIETSFKNS